MRQKEETEGQEKTICTTVPNMAVAWLEPHGTQAGFWLKHIWRWDEWGMQQGRAGTCVSKKTIRSWVIKKSIPLVWLPPRSFISALWARKTYALWKGGGGEHESSVFRLLMSPMWSCEWVCETWFLSTHKAFHLWPLVFGGHALYHLFSLLLMSRCVSSFKGGTDWAV